MASGNGLNGCAFKVLVLPYKFNNYRGGDDNKRSAAMAAAGAGGKGNENSERLERALFIGEKQIISTDNKKKVRS